MMARRKKWRWRLPSPSVAEEIRKWIMFFVGIGLLVWWGARGLSIETSWLGVIALLLGFGVITPSKWRQSRDEVPDDSQRQKSSREEMGGTRVHHSDSNHDVRHRFGDVLYHERKCASNAT